MSKVFASSKWIQMYHTELNIFLYVRQISRSEYIDPEGQRYLKSDFYMWKVTE